VEGPEQTLTGRTILVTGASRGIGAAIARAVHRGGAVVVAHYGRDTDSARGLAADLGERVHLIQGDLSQPDTAAAVWSEAQSITGGIDVLVNNAGAWIATPIDDVTQWEEGWAANLALNLVAPAELCRQALIYFRQVQGGIIINISSRSAHRGDDSEHLGYGAAKAGLAALTKGIARGFGRDGVLAYTIAPGWVATDLASNELAAAQTKALPLGEVTPPEEIAEVVAFLASGRARHTTGATIDITGADYVR
jgi:3-oxoacyl-[acyl-carrier protein] reductase